MLQFNYGETFAVNFFKRNRKKSFFMSQRLSVENLLMEVAIEIKKWVSVLELPVGKIRIKENIFCEYNQQPGRKMSKGNYQKSCCGSTVYQKILSKPQNKNLPTWSREFFYIKVILLSHYKSFLLQKI
jgi:hypothetical protein